MQEFAEHAEAVDASFEMLNRLQSAARELDRRTTISEGLLRESARLLEWVRAKQGERIAVGGHRPKIAPSAPAVIAAGRAITEARSPGTVTRTACVRPVSALSSPDAY